MKQRIDRRTAIVQLAALVSSPLFAVSGANAAEVVKDIAALRPGEFSWHPERSPAGAVAVVVSVPQQRVVDASWHGADRDRQSLAPGTAIGRGFRHHVELARELHLLTPGVAV